MTALAVHAFPGNVRELENMLERAVAMSSGPAVTAEDLALTSVAPDGGESDAPDPGEIATTDDHIERRRILSALEETRWNRKRAAARLGMTYRQLRYRIQRMGLDGEHDEAA